MPVIAVTSEQSGAGKTGVAAAIARHIAYEGRPARLLRCTGDGNSEADARFFAGLEFVPGSPPAPVDPGSITNPRAGTYVVEASASAAQRLPEGTTVLVARREPPPAPPEGRSLSAVVVTAAPGSPPAGGGGAPVFALPDDRRLAGFSVAEARVLLDAEVLVPGEEEDRTCDHLVVAPMSADAGQPYLMRFENKAVVCRFDRTDMQLAAIRAESNCLILTGGRRPSDYLFDAARAQGVPVLLSWSDTENTVGALEGAFEGTRFQGQAKLERMCELLEASGLFEVIANG